MRTTENKLCVQRLAEGQDSSASGKLESYWSRS